MQAHKDKALEEKERLIQQVNTAKSVLVKYEQQLSSLVAQLQTIQTENGHLKKVIFFSYFYFVRFFLNSNFHIFQYTKNCTVKAKKCDFIKIG